MIRIAGHLFKAASVCMIASMLMTGCNNPNNSTVTVAIQDPGDEVFPFDDYFKVVKTVNVSAECQGGPMSLISDFYITDKYAFILDSNNRILKVDLKTGDVVDHLYAARRLSGLTGDDQYIYSLDVTEKFVCKYNFDLYLQQDMDIDRIRGASSFIKTDKGFMFYNTHQNSNFGRFVVTDNHCKKASSFLRTVDVPRRSQLGASTILYPHYLFVPYNRVKMLFFDPEYNTAYLYNEKNVRKLFQITSSDDVQPDSRPPHIDQLLLLNGNILVKYSCNRKRCYAYLDDKYQVISQGIEDPATAKPQRELFIQQRRKKFVKMYLTDIGPGDVVPDRSIQAQIVFYRAK